MGGYDEFWLKNLFFIEKKNCSIKAKHIFFYVFKSFIQFDFILIIFIIYNKFIIFLYFDHDRKYYNSRIVVDNSYYQT